jgi:integrase
VKSENRLTARTVATVGDGWHSDGANLYLRVDGVRRRWIVKITRDGVKREYGCGSVDTTSLALARRKRDQILAQLADGLDPKQERTKARRALVRAKTFREVAEAVIAKNASRWRTSAEGRRSSETEWSKALLRDCRSIAGKPIDAITTQDVVKVLSPFWNEGQHTSAKRLLSRIANVFDYATAHGWRTGDNPASWNIVKHIAPPSPNGGKKHHAAIGWQDMPDFVRRLRATDGMSPLCLEMLILTASRSGEVRGMRRSEIDWEAKIWTVPPERMKGGNEHVVPLSRQALDLLQRMETIRTKSGLVFEGIYKGKPLDATSLLKLVRRLSPGATVHGARSSFRDFCGTHGVERELAERSLAHRFGNEVEAAYARSTLVERRRVVMQQWAEFLDGGDSAAVVPFRRTEA